MKSDPSRDGSILPMRSVAPAATRHDCFADEVAIDFPAVGHLIDRAREGFLSESDHERFDTLRAAVSLSMRQAHRGVVVPLEIPLRGTCPLCGGRGETWSEPCPVCSGTGDALVRHAMRVLVPPGVSDGACFRFRVNSPSAPPVRVEVRVEVRNMRN